MANKAMIGIAGEVRGKSAAGVEAAKFGISGLSTGKNIRTARFGMAGLNCDSTVNATRMAAEMSGIASDYLSDMLAAAAEVLSNEQRLVDVLAAHIPTPILARATLLANARLERAADAVPDI